ncbi:MAG: signal recognition particle protein Srp19 [Nitrososphaerota archaeon]|jgi:signal recognition particle subunit SEC65|nr:signal recognition particle protein Srp19 [Nitrososphaerota archaeon]MDG6913379.1 signal recognition particle protein Srp19 [Nitrososphaerota archaeon]MDG6937640.1 signal recognition particle protein Srp19 [Nitrososphaerota archaeon]MDG6962034.1 signal recognition particle protein Srp19 [Nitrososphaerota archaeon]MDG6969871.1 signal recognition particle protein Srp19 [Nitrososphaerota archaeon]
MKEYDRYIFWLEYFDSELKRKAGRRVPLSSATRAPVLVELEEACRRLNLQPQPLAARYPSRPARESGYVSIVKSGPKQALLLKVAKELATVRGIAQRRQGQAQQPRKK